MDKLDTKRLAQLVGYRKLTETADYDFGHTEMRTYKVDEPVAMPAPEIEPVADEMDSCDNAFSGMEDEYLQTMIDMSQRSPSMAAANAAWISQAKDELARRAMPITDVMGSDTDDTETPVVDVPVTTDPMLNQSVTIDYLGAVRDVKIEFVGGTFTQCRDLASNQLVLIPRSEWDAMVADTTEPEVEDSFVFGEADDGSSEYVKEDVMGIIRQHVNLDTMTLAHNILSKAGISDAVIGNRDVILTASGYTKLAHKLSGEAMSDRDAEDYCKHVLHALADRIDSGVAIDESEQLDEFAGMGGDERFTYTIDTMGNINVVDAMTGASQYLQGQDAQELIGQLEVYGTTPEAKQEILAQYQHTMDNQTDEFGNNLDQAHEDGDDSEWTAF